MRRFPVLAVLPCALLLFACNKAPDSTHRPLGTDSRGGGPGLEGSKKSGSRSSWGAAGPEVASNRGGGEAESAPRGDYAGDSRSHERQGEADERIAEESSPGLGTAYGEHRRSRIESVGFHRADASRPDVVFTIRYDDAAGVREAARSKRSRAWRDEARKDADGLTFALLDSGEEILPAAAVGSELYAVGRPDTRYMLAVANDTGSAFELVASVDGLDIIDGGRASFDKRGYVIDPFSSMVIEGWRTSEDAVAAFRFSPLEESYAERMGDGRNVGVIGAALFREASRDWDRGDGWEDWSAPGETWRRESADPFPGN